MLFIVEGPDGSGKTTLAKNLALSTGCKYIHNSYEDLCNLHFFAEQLYKENVVIDRSFISEVIYAKVKKRTCRVSNSDVEKLHTLIENLCGVLIYCATDMKTCILRAYSRGEDYVNEQELKQIFTSYAHYFNSMPYSFLSVQPHLSKNYLRLNGENGGQNESA